MGGLEDLAELDAAGLRSLQPELFLDGGFLSKYFQTADAYGGTVLRAICGLGRVSALAEYEDAHKQQKRGARGKARAGGTSASGRGRSSAGVGRGGGRGGRKRSRDAGVCSAGMW